MTRITLHDLRRARFCLAGARAWFIRHGLDWQAFLEEGIEEERVAGLDDALISPVIAAARLRAERSGERGAPCAEHHDGR